MSTTTMLFETELAGDTLIVCPKGNLPELDSRAIEEDGAELLALLDRSAARNVVLDLYRADYCGSTALGLFVKLWNVARSRGGRVALCNLSAHEQEIFDVTSLATLWPLCRSRADALRAVVGEPGV